jgi:hypothetical protein
LAIAPLSSSALFGVPIVSAMLFIGDGKDERFRSIRDDLYLSAVVGITVVFYRFGAHDAMHRVSNGSLDLIFGNATLSHPAARVRRVLQARDIHVNPAAAMTAGWNSRLRR